MKPSSKSETSPPKSPTADDEKPVKESLFHELFIEPSFLTALTYISLIIIYIFLIASISGYSINYWYGLLYLPLIYFLDVIRKSRKEKIRLQVAHRIPFFTDALANALAIGSTLEQAFRQASYYLKGKIKIEFNRLILKNALGKNLGELLRELDVKFPNTGLIYLISLLDAYNELGVGISPLLKRISITLGEKEKAEEKIRTILAGGSNYARLTIVIFAAIFFALSYLMRDQVKMLLSPELKPTFMFMSVWTGVGILIVTRITSLDFTRTFALKPYIKPFTDKRKLNLDELMNYSGIEWSSGMKRMLMLIPMIVGFFVAYLTSWYYDEPLMIAIGFFVSAILCWTFIKSYLKGLVEDQLIKIVEIFPELLQVFNIGLNSGLNTFLAFKFAQNATKKDAPKILTEELTRTKFAIECGEDPAKTWQKLAERLPFETVVDFCDIMVVAPMHGESIVHSINHMITSYQEKKLTHVEKKATALSQLVIPVIIAAFFPLFLFVVFAPLITRISLFF